MNKIILVGLGGCIGAILRHLLSSYVQHCTPQSPFPYGTLIVNCLGCFLMGGIFFCIETYMIKMVEIRLLLMVGVVGSFTTYSTFSQDTLSLLMDKKFFLALINSGTHLILGLLAVFLGRTMCTHLFIK